MRNYHSRFTCNTKSVRLTCQLHANRYAYRLAFRSDWCFVLSLPTPTRSSVDHNQHYTDKNANESHTQRHLERFTEDLRAYARKNTVKQVSGVFRFRRRLFGTESTRTRRTTHARTDTLTNAPARPRNSRKGPPTPLSAQSGTRGTRTRAPSALHCKRLHYVGRTRMQSVGERTQLVWGMQTSFSHNIPNVVVMCQGKVWWYEESQLDGGSVKWWYGAKKIK